VPTRAKNIYERLHPETTKAALASERLTNTNKKRAGWGHDNEFSDGGPKSYGEFNASTLGVARDLASRFCSLLQAFFKSLIDRARRVHVAFNAMELVAHYFPSHYAGATSSAFKGVGLCPALIINVRRVITIARRVFGHCAARAND
jgi:hypothetical protein